MSPYDEPGPASDPWGQAGYPPYVDPAAAQPAAPEPAGPPPTPPSTRGSTVLVAVLVSVLVVVLCGGGVAALYLIGAKDHPTGVGTPLAAATPSTRAASPSPSASTGEDPNSILKGQCVVNDGTQDAPVLRTVACGPGAFQVLARFDGTTDKNKCKTVAGANWHYFYDTSPDTLDFVLCLKKL